MSHIGEGVTKFKRNLLPAFVWTVALPVLAVGLAAGCILGYSLLTGGTPATSAAAQVPSVSMTTQVASILENVTCVAASCDDLTNSKSYLLGALAPTLTVADSESEKQFTPSTMAQPAWQELSDSLSSNDRILGEDIRTRAVEASGTSLVFSSATGDLDCTYALTAGREPVLTSATCQEGSN